MATLPALSGISFNYMDGIFLVWLIIGVFRGRKRGMTQEVLPTLQWLAIVVLAGMFYSPFSVLIYKNTNGAFTHFWANITAYVFIAFAINLIFISIKKALGEKLTGSDFFGKWEYYLGMLCGLIRFACMIIVLCALMNARVYSDAELAEEVKIQKKNFEDIRFPTYMSIQHSVLKESFTGPFIKAHLSRVLIKSVTETDAPAETIGKKREDQINMIIGLPKK